MKGKVTNMGMKASNKIATFFKYFVLILVGIIMIYPLLWMISATFKDNSEIFAGISLWIKKPTLDGYRNALNNFGGSINILQAMLNTYSYVIPKVICTVVSACIAAYGFGRFDFPGRKLLFNIMLATLFLPVLQVSGDSMNPTLEDKDILLLVKSDSMKTGDLCGFYWQNKLLLKRVIGQPGDVISMDEDGHVTVNGTVLDEPYVDELALGECDIRFPYQVPENRYFVLGDHRSVSIDSRSSVIGCVEKSQVVGRVFLRIWPLNRLAVF